MKKILLLFTILISLFSCITNVYANYEAVDSTIKVYDYAYKLTVKEEEQLRKSIEDYTKKYDMDFVFVIKQNYSGSLKTYSQDFYDYNEFGIGKTKDGVIIVLNYDSLGIDCYITTTGQAILYYDDDRIASIKNTMSKYKTYGAYTILNEALKKASNYADDGIPASNRNYYIDENGDYKKKRIYPVIPFLVISSIISILVTLIIARKNKMVKKAVEANNYIDKNSIIINNRNDIFISTHTTSYTISSGSGSGGGSSISRGSSGRSHGGGGGRL